MTERSPRHRVAVVLNYGQNVDDWRRRHAGGEVSDPTPYGYDSAADEFEMRWSDSHPESSTVRRIRERVGAVLGFDLVHAWRNRQLLRWADVVWTHTEREHLAVAAVQSWRRRNRRAPVLAQSVWLWDRWPGWGRARRGLVGRLLRAHPIECTHSRVNRDISATEVPGRRVIVLPFGTTVPSASGDTPVRGSERTRPLVLALGNDVDRDWELFVDVAGALPEFDFRIASGRRAVRDMPWPENAVCEPAASPADVADLYHEASVVAMPLKPNRHASGATTCIEATGSGCPVVSTAAGGIEDYLPPESRLIAVGDVDGWVDALRETVESDRIVDPEFVARHGLTQRDYVARYAALTRELVAGTPAGEQVSEFTSLT